MVIESIVGEYQRYKALGEGAMAQLSDEELRRSPSENDNSIATIVAHVAGNLQSRFTDFLTTDGEKPWRDRDEEFEPNTCPRAELLEHWQSGWRTLFGALAALSDADLGRTVSIRQHALRVDEALHRSLAHTSYHVGQIVYIAKLVRGEAWRSLSIPRRGSEAYNRAPSLEKPTDLTGLLARELGR